MKEDIVVVSGVMVAAVVCAWYVVQAIAGVVVHPIPTDDTCTTVMCLTMALG
jgi:hypothetical protein